MSLEDELPWLGGPPAVDCGEGWGMLIRQLHIRIVRIDPGYGVTQVKEKFGGLRYYVVTSEGLDELAYRRVHDVIAEAEEESFHICEVCGQPGQLNDGPWYRTRCSLHDRDAQHAALQATAGDETEDVDTVLGELREARHEVAQRRRPSRGYEET